MSTHSSQQRSLIKFKSQRSTKLSCNSRCMAHATPNNANVLCTEEKVCTKKFPNSFHRHTIIDETSHPVYRRRNDRRSVIPPGTYYWTYILQKSNVNDMLYVVILLFKFSRTIKKGDIKLHNRNVFPYNEELLWCSKHILTPNGAIEQN